MLGTIDWSIGTGTLLEKAVAVGIAVVLVERMAEIDVVVGVKVAELMVGARKLYSISAEPLEFI